jgi:hypothetical protein
VRVWRILIFIYLWFISRGCQLLRLYSVEQKCDEKYTGKDVEGSARGLI